MSEHFDLGTINFMDPKDLPKVYKECRKKKHKTNSVKMGKCITRHYCEECKISWIVDTSD